MALKPIDSILFQLKKYISEEDVLNTIYELRDPLFSETKPRTTFHMISNHALSLIRREKIQSAEKLRNSLSEYYERFRAQPLFDLSMKKDYEPAFEKMHTLLSKCEKGKAQ